MQAPEYDDDGFAVSIWLIGLAGITVCFPLGVCFPRVALLVLALTIINVLFDGERLDIFDMVFLAMVIAASIGASAQLWAAKAAIRMACTCSEALSTYPFRGLMALTLGVLVGSRCLMSATTAFGNPVWPFLAVLLCFEVLASASLLRYILQQLIGLSRMLFSRSPSGETSRSVLCVIVAHVLFMFVAMASIPAFLSYNSAWCCMRPWDRAALCETANSVSQLLTAWDIEHWLCKGSLLSAVQSDHQIPWHRDEDICILSDVLNVSTRLRNLGFDVLDLPGASVPARVGTPRRGVNNLAETWIDLVEIRRFNLSDSPGDALLAPPDVRVEGRVPTSRDDASSVLRSDSTRKFMPMLSSTACPLQQVKYCGRLWFAPRRYDVALETRFGWNWKTPQLANRVGTTKALTCALWQDCDARDIPRHIESEEI